MLEVAGGLPRRLTLEASLDAVPSWSGDGRWVYFGSNRAGGLQVWKVPADGGPAIQVTRNGGFAAFESPDGKPALLREIRRGGDLDRSGQRG